MLNRHALIPTVNILAPIVDKLIEEANSAGKYSINVLAKDLACSNKRLQDLSNHYARQNFDTHCEFANLTICW